MGVRIVGPGATGNLVAGNYMGTDVSGSTALGNGSDGVFLSNAANNTIGGAALGARNVVSGNVSVGIQLYGAGSSGNVVQGNLIGTNSSGTARLGNRLDGLFVNSSAGNTIGGPSPGARNFISGNGSSGIQLLNSGSSGNLVQGNDIGLDINGVPRLGNAYGIFLNNAGRNRLSGPGSAANRVLGNTKANVFVAPGGSGPDVLSVTPSGTAGHVTGVVISFSTGLDPAQAQRLANYRLQQVGRSAARLTRVDLSSATYDSALQSVTLSLIHPVPRGARLLLTISGSTKAGLSRLVGGKFTTIISTDPTAPTTTAFRRASPLPTHHATAIASRRMALSRLASASSRVHHALSAASADSRFLCRRIPLE